MKESKNKKVYYAYMRISTKEEREKQTYKRQEKALNQYAQENGIIYRHIFYEDKSAKNFDDREEWKKLEDIVLELKNPAIVIKDITRFTRECDNGIAKYEELMASGVELIFLDNPTISTSYIQSLRSTGDKIDNKLAQSVMGFIIKVLLTVEFDRAEQERLLISERTKQGIAASDKTQGRPKGKLDKVTPRLINDLKKYIDQKVGEKTITISELIREYKISRMTVYKYIELIKAGKIKETITTDGKTAYYIDEE